ncbi:MULTISPECIES: homogentisate 1,2-dioxygenase [Actinoalloteichus]|uniref:Homogentisate 1,2-dioxygenase n=1 Tax=Actinoalloteichus fjordicus TaxID=1612552 RepID=A0AAC9L9A1_9PSEU|nr:MULTISPECIES: homogentisate 1,2-dioxygenase [Actinoalloteichus]APU12205.1 homogentisate 1,2-dioxygenase [Actinoalloteichus fjordicus]APU18157.1 homogentisate 1,2-dioxygenase [Actinoalloteichus sp. GBA129-24]
MPHYRAVGEIPPKRHTQFRRPDGGLYAEELMGVEGFSADSSLLYHRHLPTAVVNAETVEETGRGSTPNLPLKPRHFRTQALSWPDAGDSDAVTHRRQLFHNADVSICFVVANSVSPLYRNAVGDELIYVQSGRGTVETIYGALAVGEGDYVVLPTSCTYRVKPELPLRMLILEATGHIGPPRRHLSAKGQFLEHSPYSERDLRGPDSPLLVDGDDVPVLVRHRAGLTRLTYARHPFDVVGWDGCLYPWVFNIRDFEPITGRIHQPPPVHQTFEGPNFVVCSFCPRKVDYHPQAVPVPYNHANVDSDELMFYVGGDYEARKGSGIGLGSLSLHPAGCTHGPQPGAVEASLGVEYFDETAVMVDTFRPLELGEAAEACEDPRYAWSWARRGPDWTD